MGSPQVQVIYTRDQAGTCVIPFVEETRDMTLDFCRAAPALDAPEWVQKLLKEAGLEREYNTDDAALQFWSDDMNPDDVDMFIEIMVPEGETLEGGQRAPLFDLKQYTYHQLGPNVTLWERIVIEVDFDVGEVDLGTPIEAV
jgi:hypothetical protein